MGYARSQVVSARDGRVYAVAASPRGDLLVGVPENGAFSWVSTLPGVLGLVSLVLNVVAFRGRWRVVIRQRGHDALATEPLVRRRFDVRRRDVAATMAALARAITDGQDPARIEAPVLA